MTDNSQKTIIKAPVVEVSQRFGKYVTLERLPGRTVQWKCRCDCGNIRNVFQSNLRKGVSLSCGCYNKPKRSRKPAISVGQVFGSLKALEYIGPSPRRWRCLCTCGTETIRVEFLMRKGISTSCGCQQFVKLPTAEAGFRRVLRTYKEQAKKYSRQWELTDDQFRVLTQQNCYYCGVEPKHVATHGKLLATQENGRFVYNGVDRLNNNLGYISSNCVTCCQQCNLSKKDYTLDEFVDWAFRLVEHWKSKADEGNYENRRT